MKLKTNNYLKNKSSGRNINETKLKFYFKSKLFKKGLFLFFTFSPLIFKPIVEFLLAFKKVRSLFSYQSALLTNTRKNNA